MPDVSLDGIAEQSRAALIAHGAAEGVADSVAAAIRAAEGSGNRICGLSYLESYCRQLGSGRVDGTAVPLVTAPRPGAVVADARFGFAQPAFDAALPEALAAARANGVASLAVAHSHTATAMGYFTGRIARAGLLALGMTNASPRVAAPGGKARVIGTNPIAFSVPDGAGGVAMQFDFSTSATALGNITLAEAEGRPIPPGWAVDAEGRPTEDPGAALSGALLSAGGYKGWGLGLMAEVLAAAMTGSTLSRDVQTLMADDGPPHDFGQFYLLIDPATAPDFAARFSTLAETVEADPGARLPGRHGRTLDPVPVDALLWSRVGELARGR
ncbi:MAG: Ldh family oxidoreductase [Pseudooceanicola sp.]